MVLACTGLCVNTYGQAPSVSQGANRTSCSNIIALAGNVDVNCSSLTPAQRKVLAQIPGMLNKILANQNPDALMAKLDEILNAETRRSLATASAPNGIAITGGTVTNPTVNNGPPDPHITFSDTNCSPNGDGYKCSFAIRTELALEGNVAFTIAFSGPIDSPDVDPHKPAIIMTSDYRQGLPPNTFSFAIQQPSSLPANGELIISVHSGTPVKVASVKRGS